MADMIIHHKGVYNIWCTISDSPRFVSGISLDQLRFYIKEEQGKTGLRELDERLERAHEKGTSSRIDGSLKSHIDSYNWVHGSNQGETIHLTEEKFIEEFLTIKEKT